MMTSIYFVRHAKPDFTIRDDASRPLTEEGKEGAIKVMKFLDDKDVDLIYSSPYKRTIDTIKPFADKIKKEIILIDGFRERAVGCWVDDFNEFAKNQWTDFDFKLENGESLKEVQTRNIESLNYVINESCGKTIVVGTHGTALSTIINYFDSKFDYKGFESIKNEMPIIIKFVFHKNKIKEIEKIII